MTPEPKLEDILFDHGFIELVGEIEFGDNLDAADCFNEKFIDGMIDGRTGREKKNDH